MEVYLCGSSGREADATEPSVDSGIEDSNCPVESLRLKLRRRRRNAQETGQGECRRTDRGSFWWCSLRGQTMRQYQYICHVRGKDLAGESRRGRQESSRIGLAKPGTLPRGRSICFLRTAKLRDPWITKKVPLPQKPLKEHARPESGRS